MNDPERLFALDRPEKRVDGVAKVTGAARYAADEPVANPAYAYAVTSSIAKGRITAFKLDAARAMPGVIEIFTYENLGTALAQPPKGPDGGPTPTMLESPQVWHDGQIIAFVVADSYEAARGAAHLVQVDYAEEKPTSSFDDPGAQQEPSGTMGGENPKTGDAARAFAGAPVNVDAKYSTPTQHHNPIELFSTTCEWNGGKLTAYDPSQFMHGTRSTLAARVGVELEQVRAVSRYVGGAFGSKGPHPRSPWIAVIARRIGRPVRFVTTRRQAFTVNTYRAETRHHVQLGATRDGKLVSLRHEGFEVTSRPSKYKVGGTDATARMYACPNIATQVNIVHADRNTPGYMRAPPETPYMFALESAMDELAWQLELDPIELRRRNDAQQDPVDGRPYSSRSLMQCYDAAAREFGWSRRTPKPHSMQEGEWLIGYGCATACYPSNSGPAAARVALMPDGKASVQISGHEIGTGAYTVAAITASRALGLPIEAVGVTMGDSDLPPVVIAGGSSNAASVANVVVNACEKIRARVAQAASAAQDSPLRGLKPDSLALKDGALVNPSGKTEALEQALARVGRVEVYEEWVPEGMPRKAMTELARGRVALLPGTGRKDVTAFAFGAHLVEVRVHEFTREIRVPRAVSAFAAGTIVNPLAAYSQYMGGAIWGISSALHEQTEIDRRVARYVNESLAEYLIPVNADVPDVRVILVPEQDTRVNPLGIKGIGEIGIVGMNAAVANAVFHATGKRIRDLPIRVEQLLDV
ncbi:MAG TPA: xanthine dehydrogenase family protein molybdopterin-binding subunit [Steroidobacteraceae bacterium]|nr:xanthine dehydrogenase family protein molybdopterin-binding subunit [Steroidobacteraceae bacterium]